MPAHDGLTGILERLDALPTPSPLAMRLLAAATDDTSAARDLVAIIREDAALVAKVLGLCRRGPRGRALEVASLDRAVVLLGFAAVRGAALAVEFVGSMGGGGSSSAGFDPTRFWRHCLGKAIVAESLARAMHGGPSGGRAFTVGLLHDLGALALSRAVPAAFDRACDEAEERQVSLDEACSASIGMTATAAALRVAARWQLPDELQAALACRGPAALAADGPHRTMILVAELADRLVRRRHLGGAGFGPADSDIAAAARGLGLDGPKATAASDGIYEEVAARAEAIGLSTPTPAGLAAEAIERANRRLESLGQAETSQRPAGDPLDALDAAGDVGSLLAAIVAQVTRLSGRQDRVLVVSAPIEGQRAELREFAADGSLIAFRSAGEGDPDGALAGRRWCQLRSSHGTPGKLVLAVRGATVATFHRAEGDLLPTSALASAPTSVWSFAIAASQDRERARRQSQRLADGIRTIDALRSHLHRHRLAASVGEIAAGLAHELNNPLCVVVARAELLRSSAPPAWSEDLGTIADAAARASALVSDLLRAVRPPSADVRICSASEIISGAIALVAKASDAQRIDLRPGLSQAAATTCVADPAQASDALAEVLQNALDAAPGKRIELSAHIEPGDGRCMFAVRDCGPGFSALAMEHALDPFFSERPAGRSEGLGLTKARALVEASGGTLELGNGAAGGAIVRIALPGGTLGRADGRGDSRGTTARLPKAA